MEAASIFVRATWDGEAGVWVATSNDIQGLAIEAETVEKLEAKVVGAIADLLELNGYSGKLTEIPVHIMAEQLSRVRVPVAA